MTGSATSRKSWAPYTLLFAVAFLVYANTFGNGWTYDDFPVIVENSDVRSWATFLNDSYPGRPLRELTYLLDHALFGLNPFGWHVQQVFWHGLNACLVFALGRRLHLARWAALLAALLFVLHPLQVEVVANISHRKDSLALAGSLGAILCYLRFLPDKRRRVAWFVASIVCFLLALSAKQTAAMLPLVCLLYEVLLLRGQQRVLARFPLLPAGLALAGIISAGWWWLSADGWLKLSRSMQDVLSFKANYFDPVSLVVYYLTILKSWLFISLKLIWPFELAPEYTFPVVSQLFDPWAIGAFVFLIVLAGALCWAARRRPVACWLTVTAICFFLPTSNLWPLTYLAADRYLYAPIAFLALLVGSALTRVHEPGKWVFVPALLILSLFAGLTWQQNQVWYSPKTLWTQAIKVSPESSFALNNMGNLSLLDGDLAEAAQYYQRSAEVNPLNPTAHYNLGMLAERRRDLQTAMSHYRAFARLNHPVYRQQLAALRDHLLRSYGIKL